MSTKTKKPSLTEAKMTQARIELVSLFPFFASALYRLRFVATPGLETMAVDAGWKLYYDPALTYGAKGTRTVMLHELFHLLRRHAARRPLYEERCAENGQFKPDDTQWNVCCDLEINDDIDLLIKQFPNHLGWPSGSGGIRPSDYQLNNGDTAEAYANQLTRREANNRKYDQLMDPQPPSQGRRGQPEQGQGQGDDAQQQGSGGQEASEPGQGGSGGSGQGQPDTTQQGTPQGGSGQAQPRTERNNGTSGDVRSQRAEREQREADMTDGASGGRTEDFNPESVPTKEKRKGGDCGSGADGIERTWEFDDAQDVDDATAQDVLEEVLDEAESHGAGDAVRAWLGVTHRSEKWVMKRWNGDIGKVIRQHMQLRGRGFRRPSRRDHNDGFIHVGKGSDTPLVGFLVDASGSIGSSAARQAYGIIREFIGWRIDFRVVAFSGDVFDVPRADIMSGRGMYQGGETRIDLGLEYMSKQYPNLELCIVITDGMVHSHYRHGGDHWQPKLKCPTHVFTWHTAGPSWATTHMMPKLDGAS